MLSLLESERGPSGRSEVVKLLEIQRLVEVKRVNSTFAEVQTHAAAVARFGKTPE